MFRRRGLLFDTSQLDQFNHWCLELECSCFSFSFFFSPPVQSLMSSLWLDQTSCHLALRHVIGIGSSAHRVVGDLGSWQGLNCSFTQEKNGSDAPWLTYSTMSKRVLRLRIPLETGSPAVLSAISRPTERMGSRSSIHLERPVGRDADEPIRLPRW